jgi:CPA2 family monovalent cation:H+ antiporter-2
VTKEGQSLILAAALLSIAINPLAFAASEIIGKRIGARFPRWSADWGRPKQHALNADLDRIRALAEKREHEQARKITEFVETFPLFAAIDADAQEELLLLFVPRAAAPGDRVLRVGERGDAMYFVVSGTVEVHVKGTPVQLKAGAFFGEMALLTGAPRTADVTAVDYCNFLVLSLRDFRLFTSRHPQVRAAVQAMAEERLAMNRAASNSPEQSDERVSQGAGAAER